MSKKIIAITLTSGMDMMAVFHGEDEGVLDISHAQQYVLMANQFIPYAAMVKMEDRRFELKPEHYVLAGDPLPFFEEAYRETFPEIFADESEIAKAKAARIELLESQSPVHGNNKTDSGIILSA